MPSSISNSVDRVKGSKRPERITAANVSHSFTAIIFTKSSTSFLNHTVCIHKGFQCSFLTCTIVALYQVNPLSNVG